MRNFLLRTFTAGELFILRFTWHLLVRQQGQWNMYHVNWKMCLVLSLDFLLLDTYCLHCFPAGNADIRRTELRMEVLTTMILIQQVWIYLQQVALVEVKNHFFEAKISMIKWSNGIKKNVSLLVIQVQKVGAMFMPSLTKTQQ